MKRRKLLTLGIIAFSGCINQSNTNPDNTQDSENGLEDTNESISYPPGLAKNNINIQEFLQNTPLFQDENPDSVSYTSQEQLTNGEETIRDIEKFSKTSLSSTNSFSEISRSNTYTEEYYTETTRYTAEFENETVSNVTSTQREFEPINRTGYERFQELVSEFEITNHQIKKDSKTGKLVHYYTSTDSSYSQESAELELSIYEDGLLKSFTVILDNESGNTYRFTLTFTEYGSTTVTKPDWVSE